MAEGFEKEEKYFENFKRNPSKRVEMKKAR
jgi:hypothetical protein